MAVIHDQTPEQEKVIQALFERAGPILVEVRFPGMATAPDWHLIEDQEQLQPILTRLGPGSEVYLNSVWDLKSTKDAIRVRK